MEFFNIYFGYFDLILVFILIITNYIFWNKFQVFNSCLPTALLFVLFGLVFPLVSMFIEIKLNSSPGDDAFNLLYTYFRFPVYWAIGLIQILIIHFRIKKA